MQIELRTKMIFVSALLVLSGFALGCYVGLLKAKSVDESGAVYAIVEAKTKDAKGKTTVEKIYGRDVLEKISGELEQLERQRYALKRRATEDVIRAKVSPTGEKPASAPDVEVTAAELNGFFKDRGISRSTLTAKQIDDVIRNLRIKKMKGQQRIEDEQRLATYDIRWKIPLPPMKRVELAGGKAASRDAGRSVKVLYVGNFHCPTCATAEARLEDLRSLYKNKLEVSYRFLFSNEPDKSIVRQTAEAALCANDQKKFWEFHDSILHGSLGKPAIFPAAVATLSDVAKSAGLDIDAFEKCVSGRKHKSDIEKEVEATQAGGVSDAPAIIINGHLLNGAEALDQFTPLIDAEL